MKLSDKCCDALGQRSEIQSELDRLAGVINELHTIIHGPDSLLPADPDTLLTAVRGLVAPEWIDADLVPPTEPGWYWVLLRGWSIDPVLVQLEFYIGSGTPWWDDHFGGYGVLGTRYIKIKQPVVV